MAADDGQVLVADATGATVAAGAVLAPPFGASPQSGIYVPRLHQLQSGLPSQRTHCGMQPIHGTCAAGFSACPCSAWLIEGYRGTDPKNTDPARPWNGRPGSKNRIIRIQLIYALLACALQGNVMPWPSGGGQIGQYGGVYQPGFHPGTMHPAPEIGRPGRPPAAMRSEGESQNCARTQPGTAAGDMPGAMHWPEGEMAAWI